MKKHILSIDQGTTGTTVLILDQDLSVLAKKTMEIIPEYPQAGWVEQDLEHIWEATQKAIQMALEASSLKPQEITSIGITNQRETVGCWRRDNLKPLSKAILWQCRRTSTRCKELKESGLEEKLQKKTGLVLDPYFSSTKIEWLLKNITEVQKSVEKEEAVFGTMDTFLLQKMTKGECLKTDVSNASRYNLMDLYSLSWDLELLKLFSIPQKALPEIAPSSALYSYTKGLSFLPDGIPISGVLGDQQAALLGQLCTEPGEAKITFGTGCFLLANTGEKPFFSKYGLLTTLAWQIKDSTTYALEGSNFMGGACVQWLRDEMNIIKKAEEIEELSIQAKPEEMGDLVFVPAMTGLGAPYWQPNARGMLYGITRGTNHAHLARAVLEGIAYQNDELLVAMEKDFQKKLSHIKVDGGASANDFLMQFQCNLANTPLSRPFLLDTTAIGAAIASGLATEVWSSIEEVKKVWKLDRSFIPKMEEEERKRKKAIYAKAIERACL